MIRLSFDPVLEMPAHLGFCFGPGFDLERLRQSARLVDVGRFMILRAYQRLKKKRDRVFLALTLGLAERLESLAPAMG